MQVITSKGAIKILSIKLTKTSKAATITYTRYFGVCKKEQKNLKYIF